jgi:zinc protease
MILGALHRCLVATGLFAALLGASAQAIEVQRVVSPGGVEAWLVEDHTNPIVAARFAFRGGAALDPRGKEGLAEIVSSLLDEGAGEFDAQAFQRRLEDMAVTLHFDAGYETLGGHLMTLSVNVSDAFDLLRLALTQPRFDDEPVALIRSQILTMIRSSSENPGAIASRTLRHALFPDHPYGRPVEGTEDSVKAITTADLKVFVAERLGRDNLVIGVVGDMTPDQLATLLDRVFGDLPGQAAPWRLPEVTPIAPGRTIVVKKAVPQSVILFAQAGIKRADKDFYPAYVMNYILGGGGFTSRLYNEVREKRGLAYSVYTALYPMAAAALLQGGAGTANARVSETLNVVRAEWRRLATDGVDKAELDDTKTYLTGSFPLRFSSSGRIAAILVAMQLDTLGIDYLKHRNSYVEAVTLEAVNRVARQLLDSDGLTTVIVGEPEGVSSSQQP